MECTCTIQEHVYLIDYDEYLLINIEINNKRKKKIKI